VRGWLTAVVGAGVSGHAAVAPRHEPTARGEFPIERDAPGERGFVYRAARWRATGMYWMLLPGRLPAPGLTDFRRIPAGAG
jgi:hypothetical protein